MFPTSPDLPALACEIHTSSEEYHHLDEDGTK